MTARRTVHGRVALVVLVIVLAGCVGTTGTGNDRNSSTTPGDGSGAPAGTLTVHFINVGQSISVLVVGPNGTTMLIDSGNYKDDGEYVLSYLKRHDVTRIDALISSHADADHIGGNAAIIEYYETHADGIGAVYDPGIASSSRTYQHYLDAVEQYDVPLYRTQAGDSIPFDGAQVRVLGPPHPYLAEKERNDNSIVLRVGFGSTSFLFTGDAERTEERYLVTHDGHDLRSTVLAAGHHGSSSSSSDEFLDAVDPAAVVVSSAYDSQYGHPHVETLRRLADRSIPVFWTATHGDVVFSSDGRSVVVRAQRRAITDPLRVRRSPPIPLDSTVPLVRIGTIRDGRLVDSTAGTATPVAATDGGTVEAVSIASIHADAAGDDRENLNDEYVTLRNDGEQPLSLGGWTVRDGSGHIYTFPDGFTLAPHATVTLHTGSGVDDADDLYWGQRSPVWNNDGDTVRVRDANGMLVAGETYP